jgi:hypothetical protein
MAADFAPICHMCTHSNDVRGHQSASGKEVECCICRAPTANEIETTIAMRILARRIRALQGLAES